MDLQVETIDNLINGYRHYKICNDKGLDLDVVELKYYKRLIDFYKQAEADLYEANHRINDLLDIVEQKEKIIDLMAQELIDQQVRAFKDNFDPFKYINKEQVKKYFEERCK